MSIEYDPTRELEDMVAALAVELDFGERGERPVTQHTLAKVAIAVSHAHRPLSGKEETLADLESDREYHRGAADFLRRAHKEQAGEIEQLRTALVFYADGVRHNYRVMTDKRKELLLDAGAKAREALHGTPEEKYAPVPKHTFGGSRLLTAEEKEAIKRCKDEAMGDEHSHRLLPALQAENERLREQLADMDHALRIAASLAVNPDLQLHARVKELERKLDPRRWTREMNDAWHRNIPNLQAAFNALRADELDISAPKRLPQLASDVPDGECS